jgi:hypothetical protein
MPEAPAPPQNCSSVRSLTILHESASGIQRRENNKVTELFESDCEDATPYKNEKMQFGTQILMIRDVAESGKSKRQNDETQPRGLNSIITGKRALH